MRNFVNRYRIPILSLGFIAGLLIQMSIVANGRMGAKIVFHIGQGGLPANSLNGVLQASLILVCVLLVCVDYKWGAHLAYVLMIGSFFSGLFSLLMRKSLLALPGCISAFVCLITVYIIATQYIRSEKNSVTDLVTGLNNRRGFVRHLNKRLSEHRFGFIVYLQLKDFRTINDNLGHEYGDQILREIARRIRNKVGKQGLACKIDGAEYAIVLNREANAREMAENILKEINKEITVEKNGMVMSYFLSGYAGICKFPEDGQDADTLIKYVDIALYSAIKAGENKVMVFSKELEDVLSRRAKVEGLIKKSLENDYFFLVFQPQYVIHDKKLRGFEALIRMKLPDGTTVSPGEFIAIAEQSDLILRIDEYVLKKAMDTYRDVVNASETDFVLSINVSAKSMAMEGFARKVKEYVEESNFPARNLEIEITEYSFAQTNNHTFENVKLLRDAGVQIALDDFGTGYTSLSQLLDLPVSLLKIDKSLIDDIEKNNKNLDFVDAVIYMGHLMGCEVISEGVETEQQLQLLRAHECEFVQGYVWSKPLPYDEAIKVLESQSSK